MSPLAAWKDTVRYWGGGHQKLFTHSVVQYKGIPRKLVHTHSEQTYLPLSGLLGISAGKIPKHSTHHNPGLHKRVVLPYMHTLGVAGRQRLLKCAQHHTERAWCHHLVHDVSTCSLKGNSWVLRGKAPGIFHPFCQPRKVRPSILRHTLSWHGENVLSLTGEFTALVIMTTSHKSEKLKHSSKLRWLYHNRRSHEDTATNLPIAQRFPMVCEGKVYRKCPSFCFVPILLYHALFLLQWWWGKVVPYKDRGHVYCSWKLELIDKTKTKAKYKCTHVLQWSGTCIFFYYWLQYVRSVIFLSHEAGGRSGRVECHLHAIVRQCMKSTGSAVRKPFSYWSLVLGPLRSPFTPGSGEYPA